MSRMKSLPSRLRACTPSLATKQFGARIASLVAIMFSVALIPQVALAASSKPVGVDVKAPKLRACTLGELKVGQTAQYGFSGTGFLLVPLTGRSNGACTVEGYPVVKMLSPENKRLSLKVVDTTTPGGLEQFGTAPKPVPLSSARPAYFAISYADYGPCLLVGHLDIKVNAKQSGTIAVPLSTDGGVSACEGVVTVSPFVARDPFVGD
jgi:Protein of unknown function (DUF4232)